MLHIAHRFHVQTLPIVKTQKGRILYSQSNGVTNFKLQGGVAMIQIVTFADGDELRPEERTPDSASEVFMKHLPHSISLQLIIVANLAVFESIQIP